METQWFLHFDTPSRVNYSHKVLRDSKKLDFSEWRRWLCEAWKNFLCVVRSYCLLSETSLGSCASNKVCEVITWRTNTFLLTQMWKNSDFYILILLQESITSIRYFETQKNWILVSQGVGFERREKIFNASLDHTVCFRRLLWDHAHLTKCAGWSYVAPILFYWRKRENSSIFVFWSSLKAAFEGVKMWWKVWFWWCFWTSVDDKKFSMGRIVIQ